MKPYQLIDNCKIFECISGSYAYGLNTPESDIDTRGVFIAPPDYVLSCFNNIEQIEDTKQDNVFYELRKFIKLAAENNPNILELLYMPTKSIKYKNSFMDQLISNRHLFLSKKARHTFTGYAFAQLKRIKGHKKWIENPQSRDPPKIRDYCKMISNDTGNVYQYGNDGVINAYNKFCFLVQTFSDTNRDIFRIYSHADCFNEKIGFFDHKNNNIRYINIDQNILLQKGAIFHGILFCNLAQFQDDIKKWSQYWGWKNNRNEKRAELEGKYLIDTKHASHLVRLLRMGKEILATREVFVERPDAKELMDIKNGVYTYDEILSMAEKLENEINTLYKTSTLRFSADYKQIDGLYRDIVFRFWKEKGLL